MVKKVVFTSEIDYIQVLNEKSEIDETLKPILTKDQLKDLYKWMVLARIYNDKALALQRQGRMGTYASCKGQEASQIGSAFALQKNDWLVPSFRESSALMLFGMPLDLMYLYWAGNEFGSKNPDDINALSVSVPVGSHPLHATGIAWAMKLRNEKNAVITYFGDGATSEGDFHEAMNFAGIFNIPVVFLCQNNQFAISVGRKKQTASKTIAQKALAYGFEGIQVDGNDILAVYKMTNYALRKAREGKGPTLIECVTYRMGDHTTADDSTRYRDRKEVEEWIKKDPIERFRKYLESKEIWSKEWNDEIIKDSTEKVEACVKSFEEIKEPKPEEMFDYMFEKLDPRLENQKKEFLEFLKTLGDD